MGLIGLMGLIGPMRLLSLMGFMGLLGLGCSNEQPELELGEPIAMSVYVAREVAASRANSELIAEQGIPDGQSFGVYALYHSNTTWAEEYDHYLAMDPEYKGALNMLFVPNFMKNQKVTYDAVNDAYRYSPVKYWPNTPDDKLSFIAYYPYSDGTVSDVNRLGVASGWLNGMPYYHVTIKETPAEQVDFLVSDLLTDCTKPSISDRVHLMFHHALSKITFRFVVQPNIRDDVAGLVVNSLGITNIYNDAILYIAYDPSTEETTMNWSGHSGSHIQDYAFQPNEYQLLLPQTLSGEARLNVDYSLTLKSYDTAFTYDAFGNPVETSTYTYRRTASMLLNTLCAQATGTPITAWEPNHHYIYTFRIGANAISFTAEVVEWGAEGELEMLLEE